MSKFDPTVTLRQTIDFIQEAQALGIFTQIRFLTVMQI